jgi:hypothetical protein
MQSPESGAAVRPKSKNFVDMRRGYPALKHPLYGTTVRTRSSLKESFRLASSVCTDGWSRIAWMPPSRPFSASSALASVRLCRHEQHEKN